MTQCQERVNGPCANCGAAEWRHMDHIHWPRCSMGDCGDYLAPLCIELVRLQPAHPASSIKGRWEHVRPMGDKLEPFDAGHEVKP